MNQTIVWTDVKTSVKKIDRNTYAIYGTVEKLGHIHTYIATKGVKGWLLAKESKNNYFGRAKNLYDAEAKINDVVYYSYQNL